MENTEWLFEELRRGMEGRSAEEVMKSVGTGRPQGDKNGPRGSSLYCFTPLTPSPLPSPPQPLPQSFQSPDARNPPSKPTPPSAFPAIQLLPLQ